MKKVNNRKGFTLVEIIVVLVILAILAAIAVPSVIGYVNEAKKERYIVEAKSIYTVIQTEEAKLVNDIDYTDKPNEYKYSEEYMLAKLGDYSTFNKYGEGIAAKKTGLPKVTRIESNDENPKEYILNWQSDDGKTISAIITRNKKVDIISVE